MEEIWNRTWEEQARNWRIQSKPHRRYSDGLLKCFGGNVRISTSFPAKNQHKLDERRRLERVHEWYWILGMRLLPWARRLSVYEWAVWVCDFSILYRWLKEITPDFRKINWDGLEDLGYHYSLLIWVNNRQDWVHYRVLRICFTLCGI